MMIHETFDDRFGSFSICARPVVAMFILVGTLAARETMIERIEPPKPGASPYSGAVVAGPFVFVSGQVGNDAKTGTTPSGFKAQTQNVLTNIQDKLSKAGCGRA